MSQYIETKLGSAGKSGMFGEIRISGAENQTLTAGEVGEILYPGPNVMKGCWNRPTATAEAMDEQGWFHTGDAGYIDADGFLFISDRVKDMVISGGENVYPAEVKSVLYEHPAIAEVAVIGLADDKWGEAVTAVAALNKDANLSLEEMREFADGKLARYNCRCTCIWSMSCPATRQVRSSNSNCENDLPSLEAKPNSSCSLLVCGSKIFG